MDYEIAKQLKECGFPQAPQHPYFFYWNRDLVEGAPLDIQYEKSKTITHTIIAPTLSDLIKACGERFEFLRQFPDGRWDAQAAEMNEKTFHIKTWNGGIFSSPEVAVAKLYIALHTEVNRR